MILRADNIFCSPGGAGYEPILANRFKVTVTRSPIGASPQDLEWTVVAVRPPARIVSPKDMQILNRIVRTPLERSAFQQADLTLRAYASSGNMPQSYDFMRRWCMKVYNDQTDEVGIVRQDPGEGCDGDIEITWYSGSGGELLKCWFYQCWPCQETFNAFSRDGEPTALDFDFLFEVNGFDFKFGGGG